MTGGTLAHWLHADKGPLGPNKTLLQRVQKALEVGGNSRCTTAAVNPSYGPAVARCPSCVVLGYGFATTLARRQGPRRAHSFCAVASCTAYPALVCGDLQACRRSVLAVQHASMDL